MKVMCVPPAQGALAVEERCKAAGVACIILQPHQLSQLPPASFDLCILGAWQGPLPLLECPILVHSPVRQPNFATSVYPVGRICAWPGYWEQSAWEVAVAAPGHSVFDTLLSAIGISRLQAPDIHGLVAPRILATLVNEAVFTLSQGVASASDIDIAMQLGTNYPQGPLAWARAIGPQQVKDLLDAMATEDEKYRPHPHFLTILHAHA